ncbi:MAG: PP0621 family protein [Burkholderiaceae bacterium]
MSRIVFFILLALAIYVGWRLIRASRLPRQDADIDLPRLPMVSCATCGLHIPRNEALVLDERYFCCEEHRSSAAPRRE